MPATSCWEEVPTAVQRHLFFRVLSPAPQASSQVLGFQQQPGEISFSEVSLGLFPKFLGSGDPNLCHFVTLVELPLQLTFLGYVSILFLLFEAFRTCAN